MRFVTVRHRVSRWNIVNRRGPVPACSRRRRVTAHGSRFVLCAEPQTAIAGILQTPVVVL
jgi:hypothetical protein